MDEYIANLKKYCRYDFKYELLGNRLSVRVDNEILYEYDTKQCIISLYERNERREVGHWDNRRISDCCFASLLKASFESGIDYGDYTPYEEAETLQELNELLKKKFDTSLFSVGSTEEKKLSLIFNDGCYQIIYMYKGIKKVIDEGNDKKYIWGRFFMEIMALDFSYKNLVEYMSVFEIEFTEDEIRDVLYP